jgi:SAM-dependent methyltransferase
MTAVAAASDTSAEAVCHVCRASKFEPRSGFEGLPRVSSDCRPWAAGGTLALCESCGLLQKVVDASFAGDAAAIYGSYQLYHQTQGQTEQVIFDQQTGLGKPRSELVLASLLGQLGLPERGRMLDMGCGTGPTLRAFSRLVEGWSLYGYDPHLPDRDRVANIPGVRGIFEGTPDSIEERFDLVTAVHVLEHVPDPLTFLKHMARCLARDGKVLVQIPYFPDSPFDLVIADHCSHFTLGYMGELCRRAGLVPLLLSADQLPKEITLVARLGRSDASTPAPPAATGAAADAGLSWLRALAQQARDTKASSLGVFGTSIGGNWLLGILGDRVQFFVDEDPGRARSTYRDRPVLHPHAVPRGSTVLAPLPPALATRIRARLSPQTYDFVLPPAYQAPPRL